MICNPYICIKGLRAGDIEWFSDGGAPNSNGLQPRHGEHWKPFCDFEREKLKELDLGFSTVGVQIVDAFVLCNYTSARLIGYDSDAFNKDSESSRLLKRAEFLKAVCEKEGVEWVPVTWRYGKNPTVEWEDGKPETMHTIPACDPDPGMRCSCHKKETNGCDRFHPEKPGIDVVQVLVEPESCACGEPHRKDRGHGKDMCLGTTTPERDYYTNGGDCLEMHRPEGVRRLRSGGD